MHKNLEKITAFIQEHHLLSLATVYESRPQCCNLFYAYIEDENCFIVASDVETEHAANVLKNPNIAFTIALETAVIGKIQGLQVKGTMQIADDLKAKQYYFKAFAYAKLMKPTLWRICAQQMKLTDNRLGFGKKLLWKR